MGICACGLSNGGTLMYVVIEWSCMHACQLVSKRGYVYVRASYMHAFVHAMAGNVQ